MNNYRQGDVLIFGLGKRKNKRFIEGFKPKGDNIIIEGEITGHFHKALNGKLYEKDDKIVLEADEGCTLIHPEHASIKVPKGVYTIDIQREYDEAKDSHKVKD